MPLSRQRRPVKALAEQRQNSAALERLASLREPVDAFLRSGSGEMPRMQRCGPTVYAAAWRVCGGPFLGVADIFGCWIKGDCLATCKAGVILKLIILDRGWRNQPGLD